MQQLEELIAHIRDGAWRGRLIESSSSRTVGAAELTSEIDDIGRALDDVRMGDRVIQRMDSSITSACALLALWERGAIPIPINHSSDDQTLEKIGADSNARFVLSPNSKTCTMLPTYRSVRPAIQRHHLPRTTGTDLALIIYTSGSTGAPKGIMLTHTNVLTALFSIRSYLDLQPSDVILCASPLTFDYGLYQVLFSLAFHLTTVLYNEYVQPLSVLRALKLYDVTVLPVVPALASALERILCTHPVNLPALKILTNTGGHLSVATIKGLREKLPHTRIYAMYGLTECKRALYLPPEDLERKLGSVGIPMPGMDAVVVRLQSSDTSSELVEAAPDEIGELYVRGSSVMQSYTHDQSSAGAKLIRGAYRDDIWLATGDLFSRDSDGYFYFRGRIKDLVKQGGYCLYPLELEELLTQHSKVESAAVIGTTDVSGLEIAHAFLKLSEQTREARADVMRWINERIELEYRPRDIRFLGEMPTSHNGKIDKVRLARELLIGKLGDPQ